ncbi:MAG: family ATPase [Gammaproteobacteria bacterium]|nr:family ATPase [Gammaproteobacteria bacterium]
MERRHNPYAPGAGLQPPELAGRDSLIEDAAIDMDRLLERRPDLRVTRQAFPGAAAKL